MNKCFYPVFEREKDYTFGIVYATKRKKKENIKMSQQ